MAFVDKSPAAQDDLFHIWTYIAEDSVGHADDFVHTIDEKYHLLADNPEMGRRRAELMEGLRSFPIGDYVIFYRPLPEGEGVEIIRVLHGAQDLESQFLAGGWINNMGSCPTLTPTAVPGLSAPTCAPFALRPKTSRSSNTSSITAS